MLYVVCGRGTNHINMVYSCDFLAREIGWDHRMRSNFLAREVSSFIEEHSSNMKMCSCLISTQIITSISAYPWSSLLECWDECQGLWQKQCEYDQQTKASRLKPWTCCLQSNPTDRGNVLTQKKHFFLFLWKPLQFQLDIQKSRGKSFIFIQRLKSFQTCCCWATITTTLAWYKNICALFPTENISGTLQDIK